MTSGLGAEDLFVVSKPSLALGLPRMLVVVFGVLQIIRIRRSIDG